VVEEINKNKNKKERGWEIMLNMTRKDIV